LNVMWLQDNKSCCNLELIILVVISIVLYLSLFMLLRLEIREGLMPCVCEEVFVVWS
jgi:hypothetical protein